MSLRVHSPCLPFVSPCLANSLMLFNSSLSVFLFYPSLFVCLKLSLKSRLLFFLLNHECSHLYPIAGKKPILSLTQNLPYFVHVVHLVSISATCKVLFVGMQHS